MDLNQFFSSLSSAPRSSQFLPLQPGPVGRGARAARRGLKLVPVSVAAKLAGDPNRLIAVATDDVTLLAELSASAQQPLCGYRFALGPSGLCVLVLDGALGRASLAALVPGLDDCHTLQARRGDVVYPFFRQPAGMKRIVSARGLAPGVSILGDDESCIVPPPGGTVWAKPAEIEYLPYAPRELLAAEDPDGRSGRTMSAPKPRPRPAPCRLTAYFPQSDKAARRGNPVRSRANWCCGISRRR